MLKNIERINLSVKFPYNPELALRINHTYQNFPGENQLTIEKKFVIQNLVQLQSCTYVNKMYVPESPLQDPTSST